jgi:predicted metal-binding membrane protein
MLLMFAFGIGNISLMFLLGSVMALEKNFAWGKKISAPLGITLLSSGAILGILNVAVL